MALLPIIASLRNEENTMNRYLRNRLYLFSCPHCKAEYSVIGLTIDEIQTCVCPMCSGHCIISFMGENEIMTWLETYNRDKEVFSDDTI